MGREVVKQQADFCGVVGGQLTAWEFFLRKRRAFWKMK